MLPELIGCELVEQRGMEQRGVDQLKATHAERQQRRQQALEVLGALRLRTLPQQLPRQRGLGIDDPRGRARVRLHDRECLPQLDA